MDSILNAAALALAMATCSAPSTGLRDDPAALAMRGIAMAQLGDFARARALLKQAARGFGKREAEPAGSSRSALRAGKR